MLTAILTHLDARRVKAQLAYLNAVAPESRFVVCHGGAREDFERIEHPEAIFIEDPTLRGLDRQQSYNEAICKVYDAYVKEDASVEYVYFIEYDHLILRGDFEGSLRSIAERSGAGFLGKSASPRNDTNWPHFTRYLRDDRLGKFIAGLSARDDPGQRWGALGTGMLFRRDALEAFCSIEHPPHAYLELFVPTVVYHLGFELADVDAYGDLYATVRWQPEYGVTEAIAEKHAGRTFVHPFKDPDTLDAVRAG